MNRLTFAASVLGILAVAAWAYGVNYRTANALKTVERLRGQIAETREDVQVLEVEWAYQNQPDRLRRLVQTHQDRLALAALAPEHYGDVAAVPYPAREAEDPLAAALSAAASSILAQHAGRDGRVEAPRPGLVPMLEPETVARTRSGVPAALAAVYTETEEPPPTLSPDEALASAIENALAAAAPAVDMVKPAAIAPAANEAKATATAAEIRSLLGVPLPPVAPRGQGRPPVNSAEAAPATEQAPASAPLPPVGPAAREARARRGNVIARALEAPAALSSGIVAPPAVLAAARSSGVRLTAGPAIVDPAVTPALAALGANPGAGAR